MGSESLMLAHISRAGRCMPASHSLLKDSIVDDSTQRSTRVPRTLKLSRIALTVRTDFRRSGQLQIDQAGSVETGDASRVRSNHPRFSEALSTSRFVAAFFPRSRQSD